MRRVCATLVAGLAMAVMLPLGASAQTQGAAPKAPAPAASTSPIAGKLSIGVLAGGQAVQNFGASLGGEVSYTIAEGLDVYFEGAAFQDVVTRRRLDLVPTVTNYLQTSQGKPATGTLTAPARYGGAGARIVLTKTGMVRPYVTFAAGRSTIALKPVFTLGGSDITSTLPQYGVSLGSDLAGDISAATFGGGGGVRINQARYYIDGGIRLTSIRTPDQPTNVTRGEVRVGYRF